jgi:hypothetical protein
MKINSAKRINCAVVDTNIGEFKVYQDGTKERWDAARGEFSSFDEPKFEADQLAMIQEAGLALLTQT